MTRPVPVLRLSAINEGRRAVPPKDARSAEGRLLRRVRDALVKHVGGRPTAAQMILIERASMLALHISQMDAKALAAGGFSEWQGRQYLAWCNSLRLALEALGLAPQPQQPPELATYLAQRAAAPAPEAEATTPGTAP